MTYTRTAEQELSKRRLEKWEQAKGILDKGLNTIERLWDSKNKSSFNGDVINEQKFGNLIDRSCSNVKNAGMHTPSNIPW